MSNLATSAALAASTRSLHPWGACDSLLACSHERVAPTSAGSRQGSPIDRSERARLLAPEIPGCPHLASLLLGIRMPVMGTGTAMRRLSKSRPHEADRDNTYRQSIGSP